MPPAETLVFVAPPAQAAVPAKMRRPGRRLQARGASATRRETPVRLVLTLLLLLLTACTPPVRGPLTARYVPATWQELPGWPGTALQASWSAWQHSCTRLRNRPGWQEICREAATLTPAADAEVRAFFERHFQPWHVETGDGRSTGLVTGYYEMLLTGSLAPKPGSTPLYGVPDDLLTLELGSLYPTLKGARLRGRLEGRRVLPYWSRAEITGGAPFTAPVMAWADDPLDAFFLEVQGSGRVQLEDGTLLRLGYADQNGHPYKPIGKWLVEQGELPPDEVSMQSIRAWAQAHPERLPALLNANPSYVFFRLLPDDGAGPLGAFNVPLTGGASIAVDPRFTPLGSPVYLATTEPHSEVPLTRLVHAQDTGGAIRGPLRADFFWGFGREAGEQAGRMKQRGEMWLLWPRTLPPPAPRSPSASTL